MSPRNTEPRPFFDLEQVQEDLALLDENPEPTLSDVRKDAFHRAEEAWGLDPAMNRTTAEDHPAFEFWARVWLYTLYLGETDEGERATYMRELMDPNADMPAHVFG